MVIANDPPSRKTKMKERCRTFCVRKYNRVQYYRLDEKLSALYEDARTVF